MRVRGASVIIVSYNCAADLPTCLRSLAEQPGVHEVIVVDNASADGSADLVRRDFPSVTVIEAGSNRGFGGGVNLGIQHASGDVLLIVNPDLCFRPGTLAPLADRARRTNGIVGPAVAVYGADDVWHGTQMDWTGMPKVRFEPGPFFYVQGCALAISAELFERLGGFDERYFLFAEDVELCWRARLAGAPVEILPHVTVDHGGGGTIDGGYVRRGERTSSDLRFGLRERNSLTMFLSCAPVSLLLVFVPVHVVKLVATAATVALLGRRRLALLLLAGLGWNFRELGRTMGRRRSAPRTVGRREALRGCLLLRPAVIELLAKDGLPRFVS